MTKNAVQPQPNRRLRDFLRDARNFRRLTRQQLADLSGVNVNTLQKYETTDQVPSASNMAALCMALDVDPRWMMRFALGEGEGEHLSRTNPKLLAAYDAFIARVETLKPPNILSALKAVRFILDVMESTARHTQGSMDGLSGTLQEQIAGATGIMSGVMQDVLTDPAITASLTPEAREALTAEIEMKSGPGRKDPSRPLESHHPDKLTAAGTAASSQRPQKRKPKR